MEQLEAAVLSSDYEAIEKHLKKLHKKKVVSNGTRGKGVGGAQGV